MQLNLILKKLLIISIVYGNFILASDLITPIPLKTHYNLSKANLGKKLFFDTRLSKNNTISCASCHILEDGGDDNLPVSFGIDGKTGTRNSPTVLNAVYNYSQFWDGHAKNLAEQVKGPIHNPVEMGTNFKEIISKLNQDKEYKTQFAKIYKDGITPSNISDAIAEFQKALTTPNSRFDKYLRGDKTALNTDELQGYKLFKEYGCISCHNGVNMGGNLLQKIGVVKEFIHQDFGLYNITKKEEDRYYFKVPSLRNIELTAPYFHDGRIPTLEKAVEKMMQHQVGFVLKEKELNNVIKFLKTLTGEKPQILDKNR
jgi:cytochrome c peroxidase